MAHDLVVAGIPLRVLQNSWTEKPSWYQGGRQRMRAGNIISTEDATTRKRQAQCQVDFLTPEEEAAFRTACPPGVAVTVTGGLPVADFMALVDILEIPADEGTIDTEPTLIREATIRLTEG